MIAGPRINSLICQIDKAWQKNSGLAYINDITDPTNSILIDPEYHIAIVISRRKLETIKLKTASNHRCKFMSFNLTGPEIEFADFDWIVFSWTA